MFCCDVSPHQLEEDIQEGPVQAKEETNGVETKEEPMELEGKKLEVKEDDEGASNGLTSQSTSPSQSRKKSKCV